MTKTCTTSLRTHCEIRRNRSNTRYESVHVDTARIAGRRPRVLWTDAIPLGALADTPPADFTAPTYALSFVSEVCNMTRILLLVENSFKMGGLKTLPIAKQGYHTATPTTTCYSPAAAAASPHLAPTFLLQYGSLPRLHLPAPLATWETGKGK